jgi:hypothetical protein
MWPSVVDCPAMTRRHAYVAFCTIGFALAMFGIGKIASWGIPKWGWWFVSIWVAGMIIIGFLIEAFEKRSNRQRGHSDSEGLE